MKTKNENKKKFTLEKFEVAKLTNTRKIVGGSAVIGGDLTPTIGTQKESTNQC